MCSAKSIKLPNVIGFADSRVKQSIVRSFWLNLASVNSSQRKLDEFHPGQVHTAIVLDCQIK
jgi:hypothetical protein